jgi:pimeloyl-ACP methyl ester carboxylesterase
VRPVQKTALVVAVVLFLAGSGIVGAWVGLRTTGNGSTTGSPVVPHVTPTGSSDSSAGSAPVAVPKQPWNPAARKAPAGLARFYHQRISWSACHSTYLCGRLRVPLDYRHPGGTTITLALQERPATDQATKVGALLVNPGGPGGSATDFLQQNSWHAALLDNYDLVALNPRGTTGSDPVQCLTAAQTDAWVAQDQTPETPAEVRAYARWNRLLGEGCDKPIDAHVSTVEAARDMDVLRAALDQTKLDYLGFSYGTELGATYASLFPHQVGRFVLDGAVDSDLTPKQASLQQAAGFQTALTAYVSHCVDAGNCFLGSTVQAGLDRIRTFLESVDAHPLPTSTSRKLYGGNAMYGLITPLYNRDYWTYLDQGLQQAFKGDGTTLLLLSDAYGSRGLNGRYTSNELQANYVINCLDDPSSVPLSQVPALIPQFAKVSPTLGATWAWGATTCSGFKPRTDEKAPIIRAEGAAPIVVIGTTRDPATPYAWAVALAHQLASGVLISRDGDGHTGYGDGNSCVDDAVESYLVHGTVPKNGLSC